MNPEEWIHNQMIAFNDGPDNGNPGNENIDPGKPSKLPLCLPVNDRNQMVCPVCHHDKIHIAGVMIHQGGRSTFVCSDGTYEIFSGRSAKHDGSEVETRYTCENGHHFCERAVFKKGYVVRSLHLVTDSGTRLWEKGGPE